MNKKEIVSNKHSMVKIVKVTNSNNICDDTEKSLIKSKNKR